MIIPWGKMNFAQRLEFKMNNIYRKAQSINQSNNQSNNQQINNQPINQSIHQSINQSINQSISQSVNQLLKILNLSDYLFNMDV